MCPTQAFAAARPQEIAAERHSDTGRDVNASFVAAMGKFSSSELHVQTGSAMVDQWKPYYLGIAAPFTMSLPVGGYDVWGQPRWRRPADAARVQLADLVRGLPRRVEAQFRRHWSFVPMLWNLYFRERVNLGQSLALKSRPALSAPLAVSEEDAAMAAAAA